jgi:predicted TIM-barrel enzyme
MSNEAALLREGSNRDAGTIVADPVEIQPSARAVFLCAALAGLPARVADIAGTLPLADANGAMLRVLDAWPAPARPARCYAGVLAVDPFWRNSDLIDELVRRRATGVINLPSLGMLDGEYRDAMAAMGFSFEAEMAFLQQAAGRGLRTAALVRSLTQARAAVRHGVGTLVLHPGLPHGERLTDRQLAAACVTTARRLRDEFSGGVEILVFRHPDFGAGLDRAVEVADGAVIYGVRAPHSRP